MSKIATDKGKLLAQTLDRYNVKYEHTYQGWQSVSCPNTRMHANGDKTPSMRINLMNGGVACHGCMLKGDAYDMIQEIEQVDFKQALEQVGEPVRYVEDDGFII